MYIWARQLRCNMKKKIIIIVGIISILIVVAIILFARKAEGRVNFETAIARMDTLSVGIRSSGNLQPVDQINVGTQVSGIIKKIYVNFNTPVKQGDLLAELDKSLLKEDVSRARAGLLRARSDSLLAQKNYNRIKMLYNLKAETQVDFEEASNKLDLAKAQILDAVSILQQAEVNLSFADIRSPINGIVQSRSVEEGQTVAADFNTPTLFTITNNFRQMEVQANVKESDIGEVRLGQKVLFTVTAYPRDTFRGVVNQIRLQPTKGEAGVTYPVFIDAPNPDERLLPGMTAYSTIITKQKVALVIPLAALKFKPSDAISRFEKIKVVPLKWKNESAQTVWVQTDKNTIAEKEIKTGKDDGVNIIVTEGLAEGNKVVFSALYSED